MAVVLPEPLGPMSPRTSPAPTVRASASTATAPPNRLVSPRVSSSGGASAAAAGALMPARPGARDRSHQRLPEALDLDQVAVGIADEGVVDAVGRVVRGLLHERHAVPPEAPAPLVHLIRDQRE